MSDGALSFAIRVDSRGLDRTVKGAIRDVERVKRVALVRAANMVRGYLRQAISNNGDVVFKKTGEQIVPPFKAKSMLHDMLHGDAPPPVLSDKSSILLNVNAAAGTADVGWAGPLAEYVGRWQDGTAGGEKRLDRKEVRHAIYRSFMRPGVTAAARQHLGYLLHSPPPQPKREFVEPVAAFVGPRLADWFEGALRSAITRRNDRYLDMLDAGDTPVSARIADARAAGARIRRRRSTRQRRDYSTVKGRR